MRAQCVLPSGNIKVGETQTVDVINCNGNHCFQEDIGYEAAMPQIIALLESSSSCSQTIDFQCFSAPLKVIMIIYSRAKFFSCGQQASQWLILLWKFGFKFLGILVQKLAVFLGKTWRKLVL